MKWLIINPLPSDYNPSALDPKEGDYGHQLAVEVDKIRGIDRDEPFGMVVNKDWDIFLRCIHSLVHFEFYINNYIVPEVKDRDKYKNYSWDETWKMLATDAYYQKPITRLARSKNGPPAIIRKITEMRDLLRFFVALFDKFSHVQ